ncbi:hypothetical protein ACJX0J_033933 [Zea mays]
MLFFLIMFHISLLLSHIDVKRYGVVGFTPPSIWNKDKQILWFGLHGFLKWLVTTFTIYLIIFLTTHTNCPTVRSAGTSMERWKLVYFENGIPPVPRSSNLIMHRAQAVCVHQFCTIPVHYNDIQIIQGLPIDNLLSILCYLLSIMS